MTDSNNTHNLICFDVETNKLSSITGYILQLSAVIYKKKHTGDGDTTDIFNQYVMPPSGVSIDNSHIHNITLELLSDKNALSFDVVFTMLCEWTTSHFIDEPVYLIAHNCFAFDMRFLEGECKRHNLEIPRNWIFIDSLVQFRRYNSTLGSDNYKLSTLYDFTKDESTIIEGNLHDSLTDVNILMFVYDKLTSVFTPKQMNQVLQNGRKSTRYNESYLKRDISTLLEIDKKYISVFNSNDIHTIGDIIDKYTELSNIRINDKPPDTAFYLYLTKFGLSYIVRREITSRVKYVTYMCS